MIHYEEFTASEAAAITGMSLAAQRDHRRRFTAWMPPQGRHPTYQIYELFQMRFVMDVAPLGVGPKRAWEESEWVATGAAYSAFHIPGCIQGSFDPDPFGAPDPTEEEIKDGTARAVFRDFMRNFELPSIVPERFVFIWDKGDAWFDSSFDAWRARVKPNDPRLGKPAVILDLPFFAKALVERLPRSAVRVHSDSRD